jgi:hypothetical protein
MTKVTARIHIAADGALTGCAPGLPVGEYEAEIMLLDSPRRAAGLPMDGLVGRIRAIQEEVARLPVLDSRQPDGILNYNDRGHFD